MKAWSLGTVSHLQLGEGHDFLLLIIFRMHCFPLPLPVCSIPWNKFPLLYSVISVSWFDPGQYT